MKQLTVEQLNTILSEVVLDAPLSIPGKEAQEARARLEKQVAEMKAKGQQVAIPAEWP